MILQEIKQEFSICKLQKDTDFSMFHYEYCFTSITENELSLICPTQFVPSNVIAIENEWSCFRIAEDAAFEKYGMIAFLTKLIAAEQTGVLVVATFDTDYLFIKKAKFERVKNTLIKNGCSFI